jgi:hypothetical protein
VEHEQWHADDADSERRLNHRDTENTEDAQRRLFKMKSDPLRVFLLCALCDSVVNILL